MLGVRSFSTIVPFMNGRLILLPVLMLFLVSLCFAETEESVKTVEENLAVTYRMPVGSEIVFSAELFVHSLGNGGVVKEIVKVTDSEFNYCGASMKHYQGKYHRRVTANRKYEVVSIEKLESDPYYVRQLGVLIYLKAVDEISDDALVDHIFCFKQTSGEEEYSSASELQLSELVELFKGVVKVASWLEVEPMLVDN